MSDSQPPEENLIGKTIGAFRIEAEMAAATGQGVRALQTTVHRTVALKILSAENAQRGAVESFLAESQMRRRSFIL